ncbi:hypothetical protein A3753_27230 [Sulfitobacter sp. HI0082]|nr:hypothetical protein A3753_27230 [Sulfitobacter sp. HI0082]
MLLLSGGVGLTPMVAMLHRLAETDREVHFLHACENGRVHALREEVLARVSDKIQARFIYRNSTDADRRANLFDAEGVIDKTFLRNHVPIGDYEAYSVVRRPSWLRSISFCESLAWQRTGLPMSSLAKQRR